VLCTGSCSTVKTEPSGPGTIRALAVTSGERAR
jgi:hypothetical protein